MIELLVVISIVALLTAILLPALQRVRKQARAVVCRSNLRQWGPVWAIYVTDNNGRLPVIFQETHERDRVSPPMGSWWGWSPSIKTESQRQPSLMKIMTCPAATSSVSVPPGSGYSYGGTYRAWRLESGLVSPLWGGYGMNGALTRSEIRFETMGLDPRCWVTANVRKADMIPVYVDSAWHYATIDSTRKPPEFNAIPTMTPGQFPYCMDRHAGHVNGLFLDWSVRKVGLKELWTLKWHREYDTAGPWTKAGGVRPEDWPAWMRKFKDY